VNRSFIGDLFGSFADTAILLPLIALLSTKAGFNPALLFFSCGLAYLIAGQMFKIPMSVQPLKSIAIAAISIGASLTEIQISGFLMGIFCLSLLYFDVDRISKTIPVPLIQNIQFGLGVLLMEQSFHTSSVDAIHLWLGLMVIVAFLIIEKLTRFSWLGIFATFVTLSAISFDNFSAQGITASDARWSIILGLVVPQMVLTIGNSVLGTVLAVKKYFPGKSDLVTPRKLLLSVGIGNILSALISGLPYCHGSGGVTAHVKGGATSRRSNVVIGIFLLALSLFIVLSGNRIAFNYPAFALTALLGTVGLHHLKLAQDLFNQRWRLAQLLITAVLVVVTHNLLFVFAWALLFEFVFRKQFSIIKP
jgi:sulfate permease, SulP family